MGEGLGADLTFVARDSDEAYELLEMLGAPDRLVRHAELVHEAAARLLSGFQRLNVTIDARLVEIGAVLHDVGKIRHSEETPDPALCMSKPAKRSS